MLRAKTNWKSARITIVIALLIVPLIAFGATQNENTTLPENITSYVTNLNDTPSENITDVTAPINPILSPDNVTDNTTDNATGITIQTPETATNNSTTGNASGVTLQTPENTTDNTTGNASGVTIQTPENATDNTSVIGLNYTINESTGESRNINVTESVIEPPKLIANKESYSLDEEPTFSFEYKTFNKSFIKNASQKTFNENVTENASREMLSTVSEEAAIGAPQKALKRWVTENETIETFVYDSSGALTDIAPEIAKKGEGKFAIKLPKERAFRVGVYTLSVELVKDEHVYVLESEFPWGLVSVNTKKSIYKPGETVEFVIVVLDKAGHSVSNADLYLTVNNPDNEETIYSTADGTITASSESGIYNLDYPTEIEGNHSISVTGLIDNVEVFFNTYFRVQPEYEFDIIRTTQSKIDPTLQDRFEVRIDVECFTDAESVTLKEFVPAEFDVYSTDAATVMQEDDTKTITWNKDLIGKKTSVSYSYAVPPVWPYLYALGTAEISYDSETFTEARPWYVAVDPISIINVQSYPAVGGNWSVKFETEGTADLTITAVNGTTWTNQPYECYDEETEVLTKEGWKLFKDLEPEEEVLTLNQETGEQEWQKPIKYLEYDYSDAMFKLTLADGSKLLVSPEHKVYGLMRDKSSSKSFVESTLTLDCPFSSLSSDQSGQFSFRANAKKSTSLGSGDISLASDRKSEYSSSLATFTTVLSNFIINRNCVSVNEKLVRILDLCSLSSYKEKEGECNSNSGIMDNSLAFDRALKNEKSSVVSATNRTHTNPLCLSFSNLPFLISLPSVTSSSSLNCLASFITSSMNRESNLRFSSHDISSSISRSSLPTSPLSNPGTSTTNSDISIAPNYKTGLLYLNTYSLLKISELYDKLSDKQLVFLDSELNPVAVKKIEEVPYTGKIYDVDVPNDIVLVKRHNETTRKPQITKEHTKLFCNQKPIKYLEYDYSDAMFELTLEDGSQLLVSPEHKVYGAVLPNRILKALDGMMTLPGKHSFIPLSPDRILQSNLRDKATYGISFKCGDLSLASSTLSSNVSRGISSSSFLMNEKTVMNSSLDKSVSLSILSILLPTSKNRNSGAINSNFMRSLFNSNTLNGLPLLISAENTTLASTTNNISNHFSRSLLAIAKLTSSANSLACSSVSFDLDTIASIPLISSSSLLRNLENNNCQFSSETLPSSIPISSGTLTTISAISLTNNKTNLLYLNNFSMPVTVNEKETVITNTINPNGLNTYSLLKISELHELPDKQLVFLDSEQNPVAVKKIEEVPYNGKIYSVTVPNRILLIRRKNSTPVWCGNSNYDLQLLALKCGNRTLDYQWRNNSLFIHNYSCNETSYETSKVLTSGKHALEFRFGGDVDYAYNQAGCPTFELISQEPATIYENSTGAFNVTWLVTTDATHTLNNSSVSLVWTLWDSVLDSYNWSLRVPSNNKSAVWALCNEQILRADNRNATIQRLNFEDNATITEGNVWKWAGADENTSRLTIQKVNDTHSYVHWNGTVENTVFENMYYLDRTRMQKEISKYYDIYKQGSTGYRAALVKFWDTEAIKGSSDYKIHIAFEATDLGASNNLDIYYLNDSYNITGGKPLESPYYTYLTSYTGTTVDDYTYEPYNSSFVTFTIGVNNSRVIGSDVNTTPHGYIYFRSPTATSNEYRLAYVDGTSGMNISFAQTNVAWTSTNDGSSFLQAAWTPKLFFDYSKSGMQHQMKLYAANASGSWSNSTLLTNDIRLVHYPPTVPHIRYFNISGVKDYDMNGSYDGIFDIGVGVATDPDGGTVVHNLTLCYPNQTFISIVNNTFTEADAAGGIADIAFNASNYSPGLYTLHCVATDDEGETSETWLGTNFTIDSQSPTITIDVPTTSVPIYKKGGEQFYVNFSYTEDNPKNYTVTIYNATATINSSSDTAYTPNSYVNASFYLNSSAAKGKYNVSVEMYDNASNYNISYQNQSVFKMGWSNVTWGSPSGGSSYESGAIITLTCLVRDVNTSSGIENYPVRFYNKTDSTVTYLGLNYTNSSGYAVLDWDTSGVAVGWYYPKCNITDNATLFYNVTADDEANTSIELSYATTLEIRNQTASQSISSINFSGATGATVVDPHNNADGSGNPQNVTSNSPVVTIYNPSSSTEYKIWLKVEEVNGWSTIINDEKFNVTANDTSPGAVGSWISLKSWGSYKDTGVRVSKGTHKDLYLAYELKGSGTGTSTVSVLGEAV